MYITIYVYLEKQLRKFTHTHTQKGRLETALQWVVQMGTCACDLGYISRDNKKREFKKCWISNNVGIKDDGLWRTV